MSLVKIQMNTILNGSADVAGLVQIQFVTILSCVTSKFEISQFRPLGSMNTLSAITIHKNQTSTSYQRSSVIVWT